MNDKNIKPGTLMEDTQDPPNAEMLLLLARMDRMQMEIDLLKETINVLKKDPGINTETLKNREKAVIIIRRPPSKSRISIPASVKGSPPFSMKTAGVMGSRIHALLRSEGIVISEKVVRRIMEEEGLVVRVKSRRKYNAYQGEISPSMSNVVNRDFHMEKPNEKWLTNITEFAIPAGKVCLSPIVDCFDGMLPYWTMSTTPDAALVNDMLDGAISQLGVAEHPMVHSDRGCHYRWSGWISRMEKAGLERSMSKKGCSPDHSACEGLFGRLKNG